MFLRPFHVAVTWPIERKLAARRRQPSTTGTSSATVITMNTQRIQTRWGSSTSGCQPLMSARNLTRVPSTRSPTLLKPQLISNARSFWQTSFAWTSGTLSLQARAALTSATLTTRKLACNDSGAFRVRNLRIRRLHRRRIGNSVTVLLMTTPAAARNALPYSSAATPRIVHGTVKSAWVPAETVIARALVNNGPYIAKSRRVVATHPNIQVAISSRRPTLVESRRARAHAATAWCVP